MNDRMVLINPHFEPVDKDQKKSELIEPEVKDSQHNKDDKDESEVLIAEPVEHTAHPTLNE